MADDSPQNGTDVISTDHVSTLNGAAITPSATTPKVQRVKVTFGDDGTARDVSASFPLPTNLTTTGVSSAPVSANLTAAAASTVTGNTTTTSVYMLDVSLAGNASFALIATAFVGTVTFEQSFDPAGGAGTWAAVPVMPEDATSAPMTSLAINTAVAYIRQFTVPMFGPRLFRVRVSTFTSGTLTVTAAAGPGWYEGQPSLAPSSAVVGAVSLAAAVTPSLTTVNTSGTVSTNTVLLAADTTRKALLVTNRGSAPLLLGFGVATTTTLYAVSVPPGQVYEVPPQFAPFALNGMSSAATQPVNLSAAS